MVLLLQFNHFGKKRKDGQSEGDYKSKQLLDFDVSSVWLRMTVVACSCGKKSLEIEISQLLTKHKKNILLQVSSKPFELFNHLYTVNKPLKGLLASNERRNVRRVLSR